MFVRLRIASVDFEAGIAPLVTDLPTDEWQDGPFAEGAPHAIGEVRRIEPIALALWMADVAAAQFPPKAVLLQQRIGSRAV